MEKIKNIGPVSQEMLRAVGVFDLAELEARGAVETYKEILTHNFAANLNLLYSLEAAIQGVKWTELSAETKNRLRKAVK